MKPNTSSNMTAMASTMLRLFRDRLVDLCQYDELIADLRKLSIEERPTGFKLVAPRDRGDHADVAFAFAAAAKVRRFRLSLSAEVWG